MRHLGDAACIVRNRAERINGDDNPRHRQHGDRSHSHAIQAAGSRSSANPEAPEDGRGNHHHRSGRGLHAHRQARNNVCRMARFAGLRNFLHRRVALGRVVVGDEHQR